MKLVCKQFIDSDTEKKAETMSKEDEIITCALCNNHITDLCRQIIVNKSFNHTFANPYGQVFEIGCFSQAKGCLPGSMGSTEFSWFFGFSWQIGICNQCLTHLGWIFSSKSDLFYGLILEKLKFP